MLNIILNLALFTVKFIGGKLSRSVSVTSDAFNNLADAVTTMFAWLGLQVSAIGVGEEHPNGHGRFEWAVALLSASSVILIGWELLKNSVNAIKNPEMPVFSVFTVVVLSLSIAVKAFLYLYNRKKSKVNDSAALKAVAVDCLSDAVSTTLVLVSLIVHAIFSVNIDGWCGILVSLFILYNGFGSFMDTIERIMGRSASKEQLDEMRAFAMQNADFEAIADLQIEDYGYGRYRVSMTALGKEDAGADQLLADAMRLKYRIFEHYGYNAQIEVEQHCEKEEEAEAYIKSALSTMDVPLQVLSLRVNDAQAYKLILLELGIDFMDNRKKKALEKELAETFRAAPEGYRILPRVRLKARAYRHGDERRHAHRRKSAS